MEITIRIEGLDELTAAFVAHNAALRQLAEAVAGGKVSKIYEVSPATVEVRQDVTPQQVAEAIQTQAETTQTKPRKKAEASAAENSEGAAQEPDPDNVPTVVELRAKAQEKGKTPEGKQAIKDLLKQFGSRSISEIPEEKRAAFMAALEEL